MKLHEIIPTAEAIISATAELATIPRFSGELTGQKNDLEAAMQENGLALVFIQESGDPVDPGAPSLYLHNMLIISVLENPKENQTGLTALEVVGLVLKAIHQHDWTERGLRNVLTVDNPAYTRGELDSGLVTYFCNFKIKTIE